MRTYLFEATNGLNWGKFLVATMDTEWIWRSQVDNPDVGWPLPLLSCIGWGPEHLWVLDLQTCEGAAFRPGGYAKADLEKHRIWVCPLYEPFLTWLYTQDTRKLDKLPQVVTLDAPFEATGYRRPGPG